MEQNERIRCLIIGSGPAGYTAAIYASRANLSPVLYEGYPEGISGFDMMEDLKKQAERFGANIRRGIATAVDFSQKPYRITIDGEKIIEADALIISTGASAKYLGLPDEVKYAGMGVSACATCDGFFYRKKIVAVVGGGDTACEETQAEGLFGENGVEGVHLVKGKDTAHEERYDLPIDGFFLAIGHKPNTDIFKHSITLDENGYIVTAPHTTETNIEGVFAAGDVADPRYRQAITAAASGCKAAMDAERYLINNSL